MRVGKRVANQKQYSRRSRSGLSAPAPRSLVPQISADVRGSNTIRYKAISAVFEYGVTVTDLMRSMVINNNSSTSSWSLLSALRIKRIDLYDIGGASDVAISNCELAWASLQGPLKVNSAVGTPIHPGCVSTTPPADSLASKWISTQSAGTTVMFYISAPLSCIVDLTIEFVYNTSFLSTVTTFTTLAGVAGVQYVNRLDQAGAGNLQCISMNAY